MRRYLNPFKASNLIMEGWKGFPEEGAPELRWEELTH